MVTATKSKPPTAAPEPPEVDNILRRFGAGEPLTAGEHQALIDAGWSAPRVALEAERLRDRDALRQSFGSDAQLAADRQALAEAERKAAAVGAEAGAIIREQERRVAEANVTVADLLAIVARREAAREKLRQLAPEAIQRQYHQRLSLINTSPLAMQVRSLRLRLEVISGVCEMAHPGDRRDPHRMQDIVDHCASLPPDHPAHPQISLRLKERFVPAVAFLQYQDDLRDEAVRIKKQLPPLESQLAQQLAEIEKILDVFLS